MKNLIRHQLACTKTPPHTCGYLPYKQATIGFIPLKQIETREHFTQLSADGFRRSGDYLYRPACDSCNACIPLRVLSQTFTPSKSQKRCWARNNDLEVSQENVGFTEERYTLYEKYIHSRHSDGDMFPPSKQQFLDFLCEGTKWCYLYEFREANGNLVAVTVVDHINNGIAPIYTFFSPEQPNRSLGTYSVLWLIRYANSHHMPYVYLGYWIEKCKKMSYKCKFRPYELLKQGQWVSPN